MIKKLDIEKTRIALQNFEFAELFREELGWSSPKSTQAKTEIVKEINFSRKQIAELSGAVVYEITLANGELPYSAQRKEISKYIRELNYENVCIFVDKDRSQSIWHWEKKQDKKMMPRDHFYMRGQPGDLFIGKLSSLVFDLSDFDKEGNVPIAEVAGRMKAALDVEVVTKKFYKSYQEEFNGFLEFIEGITDENDRKWYASVILNRLMFIYFLQRKFFLDEGNADYLSSKLEYSKKQLGKNKYYDVFLKKLFFEGFAKEEKHRSAETNKLIGKIKYLNGGLFLQHKIEKKYNGKIKISDVAFENLLKLFKDYSWNLNDTPGGQDNELNPDVLGYIFEKYINQKSFGAYYTRTEITEYLCEQTVYKLILDAINGPDTTEHDDVIEKVRSASAYLSKATPLSAKNKTEGKRKHYEHIEDLLIGLDAEICRKLVVGENAVLPNLSLLDPACGSGAFLVAAMKTLINVYAAILGKIKFLGDKKLKAWLDDIEANHPSVNYYIKKQIITNNLYGVDIMEEASEIAKLRLFLALVASAQKVDDLEPLPNIDFNIVCGNSLIGLMRVNVNMFNKHIAPKATGKVTQGANLFRPATIQGNIFSEGRSKSYQQIINDKEAAIAAYKNAHELGVNELQALRDSIQEQEKQAYTILNELLKEEFLTLGIKFDQHTWDEKTKSIGKSIKKPISVKDVESLAPFHWGYEFSEIFRKKDGFDAIITNPPWEIFKPQDKEFFSPFSQTVKKNIQSIKAFEKEKKELLRQPELIQLYLKYLSNYPHQSEYYRNATQYKNQISIVNGKKAGSDINLYKLFVEQCHNLLKKEGYCGIVIPSGIYTDLGTKKLRELLLDQSQVINLISMSNERNIFEGVMHNFKFCLLTYKKDKPRDYINSSFRIYVHEAVHPADLESFLSSEEAKLKIPIKVIKEFAPDSLSITEFKEQLDLDIAQKFIEFPPLGRKLENVWNLKLSSEFHMTNDSALFQTKLLKGSMPLFEGKMIHQFSNKFSEPQYWVNETNARSSMLGKGEKDVAQILEYQKYRIVTRAIGGSANERGFIATILPPRVFCGNSLLVSTDKDDHRILNSDKLLVVAFLNSYLVDYCIRQMVATNINMFYVYQLHIPRLVSKDKWYRPIIEKAARLICITEEFSDLWVETIGSKWSFDVAAQNEKERNILRAELDAIIAHLYGLTEKEYAYILSTFPVVDIEKKDLTIQYYKDLAHEFQKPVLPNSTLPHLVRKGENKNLEFKSTLLWDIKESARKYHIEHSVLKTIAAFLNSTGGTLLIGVTDDGQIHGLEDDFKVLGSKGDPRDNFNKAFDNLISNNFGRDIHRLIQLSLESIEGKLIAKVEVKEKAPEEVFLANKDKNSIEEFYVRLNASSVALTGKEQSKYIKGHWK